MITKGFRWHPEVRKRVIKRIDDEENYMGGHANEYYFDELRKRIKNLPDDDPLLAEIWARVVDVEKAYSKLIEREKAKISSSCIVEMKLCSSA